MTIHVEPIDTESWHAVLIIEQHPKLEPTIMCIGFKRAKARDEWLGFFAPAVRSMAETFPARG